jgi:hypothetical protein
MSVNLILGFGILVIAGSHKRPHLLFDEFGLLFYARNASAMDMS